MIERIDFIERQALSFTYTRIFQVVGLAVLICGTTFGVQFGRVVYHQKQLAKLKIEIDQLQEERKKLLKTTATLLAEGSNAELQNIFTQTPPWAKMLTDIASRLPNTVWLSGIKGATARVELPKSGSSNANAPSSAPVTGGTNSLVLNGTTGSIADLAVFVAKLQESSFISRAHLTNTRKEEERFTFEIICDMLPPQQ